MSKRANLWPGVAVAVAVVLVYLVYEAGTSVGSGPFTARIIPSRLRVRPGQVVSFKLELVDQKGRTHRIPGSARSSPPPRVSLYDSEGQQIGTYEFRYG